MTVFGEWVIIRGIDKSFFGDFLIDLGSLEGDYRFAQLKSEIRQGILYMLIVSAGILVLLRLDAMLFKDHPGLFTWMAAYRGVYVLVTFVFGFAL